jgi:hypothetical protein
MCGINLSPRLNNRNYLSRGEVGQGKIMRGGECEDVAFSGNGLNS